MNSTHDLGSIRTGALARIGAAVLEAALLATVLLLTNFQDRTQVIVFLTGTMVYSVLAVGLIALGAYTRISAERVLKAIALVHAQPAG